MYLKGVQLKGIKIISEKIQGSEMAAEMRGMKCFGKKRKDAKALISNMI